MNKKDKGTTNFLPKINLDSIKENAQIENLDFQTLYRHHSQREIRASNVAKNRYLQPEIDEFEDNDRIRHPSLKSPHFLPRYSSKSYDVEEQSDESITYWFKLVIEKKDGSLVYVFKSSETGEVWIEY